MKVYQRGSLCPFCGAEDVIADATEWQCVSCGKGTSQQETFAAKHRVPDQEDVQRLLKEARNAGQVALAEYIEQGGQVWSTQQMKDEFTVRGFVSPFVVVIRKSDGVQGTLRFTHAPRYYFEWQEDKP